MQESDSINTVSDRLYRKEVSWVGSYAPHELSICFSDGTVLTVQSKNCAELEYFVGVAAC